MRNEAVLLGIKVIKILSSILMFTAIVWEIGNIYGTFPYFEISPDLRWIFGIERSALFVHIIEGIICFYYALSQCKRGIYYGIYTLLVGFVGLLELKTKSINYSE